MATHSESQGSEDKPLELKLRSMPGISVPTTLKQKLFDDIPQKSSRSSRKKDWRLFPGGWAAVAAAAVFCVGILLSLHNWGPSHLSSYLTTEVNEISTSQAVPDYNSARIPDMNRSSSLILP